MFLSQSEVYQPTGLSLRSDAERGGPYSASTGLSVQQLDGQR
jgi:hypothetical protein